MLFVVTEHMFRKKVVLSAIITDKDFQARIFYNSIPSYVERASIFFPIVQFNWFSDFEEFSRQLNIHYWNKKIRY